MTVTCHMKACLQNKQRLHAFVLHVSQHLVGLQAWPLFCPSGCTSCIMQSRQELQ